MGFHVARFGLTHSGGTKAYFGTMILTACGASIVVKRWGKVGAWGQVKIERFDTQSAAQTAYMEIHKMKKSRGYTREDFKEATDVPNVSALAEHLGSLYTSAPEVRDAISWMMREDGSADTDISISPRAPGRAAPAEPAALSIEEQIKIQPDVWGTW